MSYQPVSKWVDLIIRHLKIQWFINVFPIKATIWGFTPFTDKTQWEQQGYHTGYSILPERSGETCEHIIHNRIWAFKRDNLRNKNDARRHEELKRQRWGSQEQEMRIQKLNNEVGDKQQTSTDNIRIWSGKLFGCQISPDLMAVSSSTGSPRVGRLIPIAFPGKSRELSFQILLIFGNPPKIWPYVIHIPKFFMACGTAMVPRLWMITSIIPFFPSIFSIKVTATWPSPAPGPRWQEAEQRASASAELSKVLQDFGASDLGSWGKPSGGWTAFFMATRRGNGAKWNITIFFVGIN